MSFLGTADSNQLDILRGGRPGFIAQILPQAGSGIGVNTHVGDQMELTVPNNNQLNNAFPFTFAGDVGFGTLVTQAGSVITVNNSAQTSTRIVNVMIALYGTSGAGTDEFSLQVANAVGPNALTDTHVATASPFLFQLCGTYSIQAGQIATFTLRLTCGGANFAVSANASNYFIVQVIQ